LSAFVQAANVAMTSELEQRSSKLFKLITNEKNPETVQALADELWCLRLSVTGKESCAVDQKATVAAPSGRQVRIIKLVAEGLKNSEIADRLGLSDKVVKNYLSKIYRRVGVNGRLELALWYTAWVHGRQWKRQ
jgi:DNA-binding NarL/FixJ family response regulator